MLFVAFIALEARGHVAACAARRLPEPRSFDCERRRDPDGGRNVRPVLLLRLYLQQILGYSPLEVGLAYAPSTVLWGAASLFLSDRLVMRLGIKPPLVGGLVVMAAGVLLFARTPVDGSFVVDVLPASLLIGLGAGVAFNPLAGGDERGRPERVGTRPGS